MAFYRVQASTTTHSPVLTTFQTVFHSQEAPGNPARPKQRLWFTLTGGKLGLSLPEERTPPPPSRVDACPSSFPTVLSEASPTGSTHTPAPCPSLAAAARVGLWAQRHASAPYLRHTPLPQRPHHLTTLRSLTAHALPGSYNLPGSLSPSRKHRGGPGTPKATPLVHPNRRPTRLKPPRGTDAAASQQ